VDLNASVAVDDERNRTDISRNEPVSITFTSRNEDSSWGEFLTYEEAARLYFWLGRVLGA
jgi:hypothetical protein